jgi:hypothetical protein
MAEITTSRNICLSTERQRIEQLENSQILTRATMLLTNSELEHLPLPPLTASKSIKNAVITRETRLTFGRTLYELTTFLHIFAEQRDEHMIRLLIDNGANILAVDRLAV